MLRCYMIFAVLICSCVSKQQSQEKRELATPLPTTWKGEIVSEAYLDCFQEGLKDEKGKQVYCEASAIVYYDEKIIFASDKPIPKKSSFMYSAYPELKTVSYLKNEVLEGLSKIEDLTLSPDENYVLATTAFDRYDEKDIKFDSYNQIVFWIKGQEQEVKRVSFASDGNFIEKFRKKITASISSTKYNQIDYFKIEGVALLPPNRIVFGIRELGKDYEDFEYSTKLVATSFDSEKGILGEDFQQVYDFKPDSSIKYPLAVSSVEFDRFNDRVFILTSYEVGQQIGAYLWSVDLSDFEVNKPPQLIVQPDGSPLVFIHKAEGITVVDSSTVVVIHDDDRVLEGKFKRAPNQNAYSVVRLLKN